MDNLVKHFVEESVSCWNGAQMWYIGFPGVLVS